MENVNAEKAKSKKGYLIAGIILGVLCLCSIVLFFQSFRTFLITMAGNFLNKTLSSDFWNKVLLVMEKGFLVTFGAISVILFLLYFNKKFNVLMSKEKSVFVSTCKEIGGEIKTKNFIKGLLILLGILLVSSIALIRANVLYCDDTYRAYEGAGGWTNFSRYVTFILANFVHGWFRLADISPLGQILALIFLTFASIICIYALTPDKKITIPRIIAVLPLSISPYMLQCLSYKYDCPYMGLSVLFAVIPILFKDKDLLLYGVITFISTVLVCTTYQASLGLFPMLVLFICLYDYKKDKINFKSLFTAVAGYLAGLLFFKLFLMVEYSLDYVSTETPGILQIIPIFFGNLFTYFKLWFNDSNILWNILVLVIVITFVIVYVKNSRKNKLATLGVFAIFFVLILCITFGIYPALVDTSVSPRAMIGIGGLIAFISLSLLRESNFIHNKIFIIAYGWCIFTFCFVYGNALEQQKHYEDFTFTQMISDLNDIPDFGNDSVKNFQITGRAAIAPINVNNGCKSYPVLNRLLSEYSWNSNDRIRLYNIKNINRVSFNQEDKAEMEIIKDTMYYKISCKDNNYLVELK